jgi:hypothetical protein
LARAGPTNNAVASAETSIRPEMNFIALPFVRREPKEILQITFPGPSIIPL